MAASKAPAPKKSNTGKLIFVAVAFVVAAASLAWQFGILGGNTAAPDPTAPPAVAETAEEKEARQEVEETLKSYEDETGETAAGS